MIEYKVTMYLNKELNYTESIHLMFMIKFVFFIFCYIHSLSKSSNSSLGVLKSNFLIGKLFKPI